MKFNPRKHHRHSIRLKGYDYRKPGWYFITTIIQNRSCLLGDVVDGKMVLNDAGEMISKWWNKLETKFLNCWLDEYIIMPNHFHGIIQIARADQCIRPNQAGQSHGIVPTGSVPQIIQWFKTMTTNEYIRNVKKINWIPFNNRFWQRNYWEHIIREESELNRIRQYIINNPCRWEDDAYLTDKA